MPSETLRVGAGVFIQHDDGRILLVHHAKTGYWVIPGGKAEPGETPRQCAVREAREETGLDGRPGRLLAVQHLTADRYWGSKYIADPYELFVFALHVHLDQYADIRVPDGELLGWDWYSPDERGTGHGRDRGHSQWDLRLPRGPSRAGVAAEQVPLFETMRAVRPYARDGAHPPTSHPKEG
ncbi:hypothetical protein BLA24_07830 [Streptomyces cinnamoneus]|uniref:Nudix hydrolase domain-containing protein n=1 Tax=Streptomyces cinnamoneus TaxID=53446 RepID=A0A2G1XM63_STRCJ|nr:NUDIX hydrolase [Streptomyces cinnamoneus]PHQ52354.1 hypothetical protein BLA24_07830 [Streptomyces cinnamoneus]PPT11556.1 NUDIX hydrolase [Streptomyces cinnamoneus]